jgi:chemotaxis protein CheX
LRFSSFLPIYTGAATFLETHGTMTAPPAADNGEIVTPRSAWFEVLRATTAEVFSMMVGGAIVTPAAADSPVVANVTGVVGIAGAVGAIFSLRCSVTSATKIASQMLGVSLEEAAEQRCDAIGEICNIVAGYFKAKIGYGDKCMLTVPTVIVGGDYRIHSLAAEERLEFPVNYEGEPVWIALEIRQ